MTQLLGLGAWDPEQETLNVIVETPKGSRNKYKYEPDRGLFQLRTVLPLGSAFPFDFGFIPSTMGEDGDPLDVLVLMDEPVFPGCLVPSRLLGVIEAEQTERDGDTERNDRLIAVAEGSHTHRDVEALRDLNKALLKEIEHFFVSYNRIRGKTFAPAGRHGPHRAAKLVKQGIEKYRQSQRPAPSHAPNGKAKKSN